MRSMRTIHREGGSTAVEYSVIAGAILAVLMIAAVFLGKTTQTNFECAGSAAYGSNTCTDR